MCELTEKLRSYNKTSGYSTVMRKAADEIERLQKEVEVQSYWGPKWEAEHKEVLKLRYLIDEYLLNKVIIMSNRNEPDDCRSGKYDQHPLSPDYDDSERVAMHAYLENEDNVKELILRNAERLAVEFVCGGSISVEIVKIAREEKKKADEQ